MDRAAAMAMIQPTTRRRRRRRSYGCSLFCSSLTRFLIVLLTIHSCNAFKSDELVEDDEDGAAITEAAAAASSRPRQLKSEWQGSARRAAAEQGDGSSLDSRIEFGLEHAFGDSQFSDAGSFSARLKPSSRGGQALVKLRLSRKPLSDKEKDSFKELIEKDGFYTIRVPANVLNPGKNFVVSSTKARCLSLSDLEERFDIYMEQGNILAVGYGAARGCSYPRQLKLPSQWSFSSLIVSRTGEIAAKMVSIAEDVGIGVNDVGEEDSQLKKLPEKFFWAKYWMYIVPMGLIVLNAITQVANVQDEQNPGQVTGQGAGQVAGQRGPGAGGPRRR